MKFSLQQSIYIFTISSCLLFIILVTSVFWSTQVIDLAFKRETYSHQVENQTHILKLFITSENIYASNYNTDSWLDLGRTFTNLLQHPPSLTSEQLTIQKSIESQNKNILRLFNTISENKLINANEVIKKHLKLRLITQLEAIQSDSVHLSTIIQKDIKSVIRHQIVFILTILILVICILAYGAFRLSHIFRTSIDEVKAAFEKNRTGDFQEIKLSDKSEEFISIVNAFNAMNKELNETTVSLAAVQKIVDERTRVLENLSKTDALTNVANRRALFERGIAEFSRSQRMKSQLSLILLDCDFFKKLNDQYGHLFGDKSLKQLTKVCTNEIRNIDFFARYGGEEFIILLPDSNLNGAKETAKRIQCSLANNPLLFEEQPVYMTVSIGICTLNSNHCNFEQLVNDADDAMYRAKSNGRNRIEIAEANVSH
jgi:diguanylate cyclase (GGDEF)-like protein